MRQFHASLDEMVTRLDECAVRILWHYESFT